VKLRRKLIEVALPLEAINKASVREKSIRHGHPSTLHLWWARRPLATARAVIFSQMVDDPSEYVDELLVDGAIKAAAQRDLAVRHLSWAERERHRLESPPNHRTGQVDADPEPTLEEVVADHERQRLFRLIERLVEWENSANEPLLDEARAEIERSWKRTCRDNAQDPRANELFNPERLPTFHDPFAGGGSLPLEAQRLGLVAHATDLNPVAVLISKAMIEIPPLFARQPPIHPSPRQDPLLLQAGWIGGRGLAEDVRYYGNWMRDEAEKQIGHLYPKVEVTSDMAADRPDLRALVGRKLTVIAWLWARTVRSPNPAFADVDVPLASTFVLSKMKGHEAYLQLVVEARNYRFDVRMGATGLPAASTGTKLSRGANFRCVMSESPIDGDYVKAEGRAGRLGMRLMAVVAEGERGRVYLSPTPAIESVAAVAAPTWTPEASLPDDPRSFWVVQYGLTHYADLFTPRQLVALTTFSDLVAEARAQALRDARLHGGEFLSRVDRAEAYADSIAIYLALIVDRLADYNSALCTWHVGGPTTGTKSRNTFSRQGLAMTWDLAEVNPLSGQSGSISNSIDYAVKSIAALGSARHGGLAWQEDATSVTLHQRSVVSTDPPYYDNVPFADLSDFFYIWLRHSIRIQLPDLFATLTAPKATELVANPYRQGGKIKAERFFLDGMTEALHRLAEEAHPAFPVTIYYAFKQTEGGAIGETRSTGWETFLGAINRAGFALTGTWPMRTELSNRMNSIGSNALASSIVLVCRPRGVNAVVGTQREFVSALKRELPGALVELQRGNIAPVDLAQAAIGPGMAAYTRFARVLDAEGKMVPVREALSLINHVLDEVLAQQEGDFDPDTRWAVAWFDQFGFSTGDYGVAETLSKAKNTSVSGLTEAGIVSAGGGRVRLLAPSEFADNWDPRQDRRRSAWEVVHQLIRILSAGGEEGAARIVAAIPAEAEIARELAYRMYVTSERRKRVPEALSYNGLVQSWPEIMRLARGGPESGSEQGQLFGEA
jgi:putative DNA methylase